MRIPAKKSYHKLMHSKDYSYLLEFKRPFLYGWKEPKNETWVKEEVSEEQKEQKKKLYNFQRWHRARKKIIDLVAVNHSGASTIFVTFTYGKNMKDLNQGWKDWKAFIRRLNNINRFETKYIVVPEFQKRGAVHFHALFFNVPYIKDIGKKFFEPIWTHGKTQAKSQKGYSREQVANYLGKYVSKDTFDERLSGRRSYECSRNIIRPRYECEKKVIDHLLKNKKATEIQSYNQNYNKIIFKN
ncbi:MAG: hypothetical protein QXI16_03010 [Sulfolobaceae archaeon]